MKSLADQLLEAVPSTSGLFLVFLNSAEGELTLVKQSDTAHGAFTQAIMHAGWRRGQYTKEANDGVTFLINGGTTYSIVDMSHEWGRIIDEASQHAIRQ